jgi:iron complex outermembrane receptor protein
MSFKRLLCASVLALLIAPSLAGAQGRGRIEGRITRADGSPVTGVTVTVKGFALAEVTDINGEFTIDAVPAGTRAVVLTLGENVAQIPDVEVPAGGAARVDHQVDWAATFEESITVFSASRRTERVVDAPAAVTIITAEEVERQAATGQLPKLLEFTPGAETTQSGLYDYNFNTRGFNSSLNRRVATLIDGRDPAVPFLGAQEWAAISFPLDDLANVELVRGPSAALYGANASSGVLNLTTKRPRDSQGGFLRLTGGELKTRNADFRWAGGLGGDWYLKAQGGVRDTGDFTVSRRGAAEYSRPCGGGVTTDCLPQEAVPLKRENDDEIRFGSLRLDKYLANGHLLTFEGGRADIKGPAFQTGIGRVQLLDVERPWARANYSSNHWNAFVGYNGRKAPEQLALASGTNLSLDTSNVQIEAQTHWDLGGKSRLVVGASYRDESIDSKDPKTGLQTLIFEPVDSHREAVFGQIDWAVTPRLKLVLAGRWDDSTLHDSQFSPKGSVVFAANPDNTFRLTYNEAFQVANYSEFFLQANAAPPLNLQPFEGFCAAAGVSCGFAPGPTRVLALGNKDLKLEQVKSWELGYNSVIRNKGYFSLTYYNSQNENFITDLLSQVGTPLGRINPNFGPYQPPAGLPEPFRTLLLAQLQAALGPSYALLSNNLDGTPILAAASYTNFGKVDTQGVEVGLNYYFTPSWSATFAYSWFDFNVKDTAPGLERLLLPNSPENQFSLGFAKVTNRWDAGVNYRWVDTFRWVVGPFQGDVESYSTVDLNANYRFNDHWGAGVNVANLFDDQHWESFGGDLIGRRALGHVSYSW